MKNKLILFLTTFLLLTGCNGKKNSSNGSNSSNSSSSSIPEPGPVEYGYGYYDDYYGQLTWDNGEDLKNKLHTIIRNGYKPLRYNTPNWESNSDADKAQYDFECVDVVYSKDDVLASYTQTGWQREHAFAASLMTDCQTSNAVKFLGRATDFHNLFAGSQNGNSSRSNKNFGVADKTSPTYTDRTVDNGNDGYSFDPKTFEPGNKDKGRLARAIFYMATMYKDDEYDNVNAKTLKGLRVVEENVDYTPGNCEFAIGHLSELLNWNNSWAVDYLEMQHNESVYTHVYSKDGYAQGNRNPFVDYPSLVDYIFGDKQNQSGDLKYQKPSCADLRSEYNEFSHYAIASAQREYSVGDTLTASDFSVYKVNKNYTYASAAANEYTNSLLNHTFTSGDGEQVEAVITAGEQTIKYTITISNMQSCSYYSGRLNGKASLFTNGASGDQNIPLNGVQFTFNITGGSSYAVTNENQLEAIKMGSGTSNKEVEQVVITTANSYTVDQAYIACRAANTSSSFTLTIKVGSETVYTGSVGYNANKTDTYGESFSSLTGKVTFILSGSNALSLGALAFNVVS